MARRKFFLTVSYEMPTLGFHVSDGSPLAEKVKKKAEQLHDGKVSAYVRSVVERDLSGESSAPDAVSPTILEDLCARLRGEKLDALRAALHTPFFSYTYSTRATEAEKNMAKEKAAPINQQPKILAELIEALIDYAEDKGSFGRGKFTLVSESRLPLARLIDEALEAAEYNGWWVGDENPELAETFKREFEMLNAAATAIDKLLPAHARRRKQGLPTHTSAVQVPANPTIQSGASAVTGKHLGGHNRSATSA